MRRGPFLGQQPPQDQTGNGKRQQQHRRAISMLVPPSWVGKIGASAGRACTSGGEVRMHQQASTRSSSSRAEKGR